jgi:hypothetical protein
VINKEAVFAYRPKPVIIRIRKTQREVCAKPYGNGWLLANGDLVHRTAATLVRVINE